MAETEYMHPRIEELCDVMPAGIGRTIRENSAIQRALHPFFRKGRHVNTTQLRWFLILHILASGRRFRRGSLRFVEDEARIRQWLVLIEDSANHDLPAARELAECPRLIKGYSDTFARGLANYQRIISWYEAFRGHAGAAAIIASLRNAALQDEIGTALDAAFAEEFADTSAAQRA